jgi:hypothetical protein
MREQEWTGVAGDPSPKRKRAAFTYDKVPESTKTTSSSSKDTAPEPVQSVASGSSLRTHKTRHGQNVGVSEIVQIGNQ